MFARHMVIGYTVGVARPECVNTPAGLSSVTNGAGQVPERYSTAPRFPVNRTSSAHACAGGAA